MIVWLVGALKKEYPNISIGVEDYRIHTNWQWNCLARKQISLQIRRSLTDLDQNYIVVTTYKTNGNIADNCKRFYAPTLLKESGVTKGKTIAAKVIK